MTAIHLDRGNMVREIAYFGYIDYFVNRRLERLPVEFFDTATGRLAWLDGGQVESRLLVTVTPEMHAELIGDFATVMRTFQDESRKLFSVPRLWGQCIQHGAGLLLLFQSMVIMHLDGCGPEEAINAAVDKSTKIHESEIAVANEIRDFFLTPGFLTSQNIIDVRPVTSPNESGIFSLV